MWKLIHSEGRDDPELKSYNNHLGRQFWEFHPNLGTPEERAQIEKLREEFTKNRFQVKESSDLLFRLQFAREHPLEKKLPPPVKVGSSEDVSEEAVETTLRRALRYFSTLQTDDGFWPGDYAGILFLLPGLVIALYVTGALDAGRMWCHCRMVYLPMSYLYGKRFVGPVDSTILSLRGELYTRPYHEINWDMARNECAKEDLFYPHLLGQELVLNGLQKFVEPLLMAWPFSKLRKKALSTAMQHIEYEDESTQYICIGPVNKALNMICRWIDDPNSRANKLHLSRVKDYLWVAEDGMKYQAYNGSQLWDVIFAVQAILGTKLSDEYGSVLKRANEFIRGSQNSNGGFGSYELARSYPWLEMINPAETFGGIMIDYQTVECTSSVTQGLYLFKKLYPDHRSDEIESCIRKALEFIESVQLSDGSWFVLFLFRPLTLSD
ncbi:hypothetical protein RJ639_030724 [Escallonia herrerae]|uniref:Squalene cyclase C-terminal domain-containing protein n=1 Tax=Escallonia herrerae TaxID=1293975 RepID=A0AA88X307_9ASTE|nr:hypothetical protein RJ639_030724 [Escallonia herrerae]